MLRGFLHNYSNIFFFLFKEIEKILKLGVSPRKIVYSNTVKEDNHIKYASN